jgi:hypothetical protein
MAKNKHHKNALEQAAEANAASASAEAEDHETEETVEDVAPEGVATPPPPVDNEHVEPGAEQFSEPQNELRTDGPTLDEFVAAGYKAEDYPPAGFAARSSVPDEPKRHQLPMNTHFEGDAYHPNEQMAQAGLKGHSHSAPLLDAETHDFGPTGGEEVCRKCGKSRADIARLTGKKLTLEEVEHPDVKDGPLLPPRLR